MNNQKRSHMTKTSCRTSGQSHFYHWKKTVSSAKFRNRLGYHLRAKHYLHIYFLSLKVGMCGMPRREKKKKKTPRRVRIGKLATIKTKYSNIYIYFWISVSTVLICESTSSVVWGCYRACTRYQVESATRFSSCATDSQIANIRQHDLQMWR